VSYRDPNAVSRLREIAPDGVNRVIEVALTSNLSLDRAVLADLGTIVCYTPETEPPQLPILDLMFLNCAIRFVLVYRMPPHAIAAAVRDVTAAAAEGALTLLPTHSFPLEHIAAAHDAVEAGAVGKVLVDVRNGGDPLSEVVA
jgi:NADPH:quinone reductase